MGKFSTLLFSLTDFMTQKSMQCKLGEYTNCIDRAYLFVKYGTSNLAMKYFIMYRFQSCTMLRLRGVLESEVSD